MIVDTPRGSTLVWYGQVTDIMYMTCYSALSGVRTYRFRPLASLVPVKMMERAMGFIHRLLHYFKFSRISTVSQFEHMLDIFPGEMRGFVGVDCASNMSKH